jgi:hypothetical protein
MNRNFAESMYGRSSIEIANFVLIRIQTWQFLFLIGPVYLAKGFQRRRLLKSANQKQELPVAAMFVNRSGQNEQSL